MIGDCHTAALVSKQGSIDWLCLPHFDSAACFASLLGTAENGRWSISPSEPIRSIRRRYREGTLILETEFETESGSVTLIDCMTPRKETPDRKIRDAVGRLGAFRHHILHGLRMRVRHYALVTGFHQPLHHVRSHSSQAYHSELHSFPSSNIGLMRMRIFPLGILTQISNRRTSSAVQGC